MIEPLWLEAEAIDALHREHVALFGGGSVEVRDANGLHAALAAPRNLFNYADPAPDLFDLAARYAYGLAKNHPYVDGNKRTAFQAAFVFLRLNSVDVRPSETSVVTKTLQLASGETSLSEYAAWLRASGES